MKAIGKSALIKLGVAAGCAALIIAAVFLGQRGERAGPETASALPLAIESCADRTFDGGLALAVTFTEPPAARQDFSALMRVSDQGPVTKAGAGGETADASKAKGEIKGAWMQSDNPRVLLFPNVPPERNYTIEVSDKLVSARKVSLSGKRDCKVASQGMPPSYFFASRGTVLPPWRSGGLPVVTVNAPELDVQFLKIHDKSLPVFMESILGHTPKKPVEPGKDQNAAALDQVGGDESAPENAVYGGALSLKGSVEGDELSRLKSMSSSVYLGRFKTSDVPNRRAVTFLQTRNIKELQEPGLYVAVMGTPGDFSSARQVTYFYVSDIGVHVRRNGQSEQYLDAFATSLKTGRALAGVNFELLDETGDVKLRATSDGDGRANFSGVGKNARVLLARMGRELAIVALHEPVLDLAEFDITGRQFSTNKLFVYAGRDIYRPGESFDLSLVLRDSDAKPVAAVPITMTLKAPDGRVHQTLTVSPRPTLPGYYQQLVRLPTDAATGTWLVEARLDPAGKSADAFWKFQVEEFLPERMKLALSAEKPFLAKSDAFVAKVQGDYLYGAPAAGNRLTGSVFIEPHRNPVSQQWPGFVFGDSSDKFERKREAIEEVALDARGSAEVGIPVAAVPKNSPLLVRASFNLLESGGRPVVRSIERTVWPGVALIGIRPLFDRNVTQENSLASFELVRVKPDGKFAPLSKAKVRLVREDREYYWRFEEGRGWNSGYNTREELEDVRELDLKERSKITLPVKYGRYRIEIEDPELHLTATYGFYAGWYAQDAESIGNRPDLVNLKLENAPAVAGKDVRLTVQPPHDGEALITVEGDRVLWVKRVAVSTRGTVVSIPVSREWKRHDLYVSAVVFRPGSDGDRITPARAVGIVPMPLARSDRNLGVKLSAPSKAEPEKKIKVKVQVSGLNAKAQADGPAFVTVSAVDAGILNVTSFASPDPFDFFFGKHRYAADLLDNYGKLIEYMDGSNARLKWGGDASIKNTRSMPKRVKLIDLFSGPVVLNAAGEAEITLDLPDFNGTLRLMATAIAADRYGKAEQEVIVAAPVVAELSTPRFISPGDTAAVALEVTNLSGADRTINATLEGDAPLVVRGAAQNFKLANQERKLVRFNVSASGAYGLGRLRVKLVANDGASPFRINREFALQVLPVTPLERQVRRVRLAPQEAIKIDAAWAKRFHQDSLAGSVALDSSPPLNVRSAVKGLIGYAYGCAEQTTSAAYPHVWVDEKNAADFGLNPVARAEREKMIATAFGRLSGMQSPSGAFSLWGRGDETDMWLTAYVMSFMQDAREREFEIPKRMHTLAQQFLLQELQQGDLPSTVDPGSSESLSNAHKRVAALAFAGYVLARDQKAPLSSLRRLHDEGRKHLRSSLPLVHLGLALKLMGDDKRASVAFAEAVKKPYGLNLAKPELWWSEWLGDYGSPVRDAAASYALLMQHKIEVSGRDELLFELGRLMGSRQYYSTQDQLALLLAAQAAGGKKSINWQADLKLGSQSRSLRGPGPGLLGVSAQELAAGGSIVNKTAEPLYVEAEVSGYPIQPPAASSEHAELVRQWYDPTGNPIGNRPLKVGEIVIARLTVKAKRNIEDALIIDRIPAGLEIDNVNLSKGEKLQNLKIPGLDVPAALTNDRIRHREYRDDRFVAAARLAAATPLELIYMMRVVTPGTFVNPAPFAEDMYRAELRAVGKPGAMVTIIDPLPSPSAGAVKAVAPARAAAGLSGTAATAAKSATSATAPAAPSRESSETRDPLATP